MAVKTKSIAQEQPSEDAPRHLNKAATRAYSGQKNQQVDNKQIAEFLPMVHKIARQVVTYLKPPLSFEDLVSAGTVGLVKAAREFDPSRQVKFKTYAYIRIKGAILDELRGWSFVPANLNKRIQDALRLSQKILEETGSAPTEEELSEKLEIPIDELYKTLEIARAQHFVSLDWFGEDAPPLCNLLAAANTATADQQAERAELTDKLAEAIEHLPQKQRQIIIFYYQQHLTMKQIAEVFEITESRVSQLHSSAIFNLSVRLKEWKDARL